ncbi:hypothetical protein IRJ41_016917 [Triplophysa rosa]|uniref:Uncharacterized protein n=1 Tax=Triplophysa rosa TaxID=992332 RepID=A0A9W7WRB9_TRIRA|nr:hypothetical protein IRJ41_016917 [Triplophysa rosa]
MASKTPSIPLEQASASHGPTQLPLGIHIRAAPLHLPLAPAPVHLPPAPLHLPPAPLHLPPAPLDLPPAPLDLPPAPLNLSVAGSSPPCASKWAQTTVRLRYKTVVDSKKTGSGSSSWVFFSSMEDLLANDPSVVPVLVVSSFPGSSSDPVTTVPSTSQPCMPLSRRGRCQNSCPCKSKHWKWQTNVTTF